MITINEKYQVTLGESPYSWTLTSDCDAVTFGNVTGTSSDGIIDIQIIYPNETYIDSCAITLTVTDANGCSEIVTVNPTNPCTNFTIPAGISLTVGQVYTFSVAPTGGSAPYTYSWLIPQGWQIVGNDGSNGILDLTTVDQLPTSPFTIKVIVTDSNGCTESLTKSFDFCNPELQDAYRMVQCLGPANLSARQIQLKTNACPGGANEVDWSTLVVENFVNSDTNVPVESITLDVNHGEGLVSFAFQDLVDPGVYIAEFYAFSHSGAQTNTANIYLTVPDCDGFGKTWIIQPANVKIDCGDTTITIDIDELLVGINPEDMDWSTFTIVNSPTKAGASYTWSAANHTLTYNVGTASGVDKITFSVDSDTGENSGNVEFIVNLDCNTAPVATDDSFCATCGENGTLDILANDTGDIDPKSVVIISGPTIGTANVNTNGTLGYAVSSGEEGADQIKYKVNNNNNDALSNEGTVDIEVICAGSNISRTFCTDAYDLGTEFEDLIPGSRTAGGDWTLVSGPNNPVALTVDSTPGSYAPTDSVGSDDDPNVEFSVPGTYVFRYTVTSTCATTHTADFTITIEDPTVRILERSTVLIANITGDCSAPTFVWEYDSGSGFITLNFTTQTIPSQGTGDYRVTVTCDECDVLSPTYTVS
jgi:hypothetical protein